MGPRKGIRARCTAGREKKLRRDSEEMGPDAINPRQEKVSSKNLARGVHFIQNQCPLWRTGLDPGTLVHQP